MRNRSLSACPFPPSTPVSPAYQKASCAETRACVTRPRGRKRSSISATADTRSWPSKLASLTLSTTEASRFWLGGDTLVKFLHTPTILPTRSRQPSTKEPSNVGSRSRTMHLVRCSYFGRVGRRRKCSTCVRRGVDQQRKSANPCGSMSIPQRADTDTPGQRERRKRSRTGRIPHTY